MKKILVQELICPLNKEPCERRDSPLADLGYPDLCVLWTGYSYCACSRFIPYYESWKEREERSLKSRLRNLAQLVT